MSDIVYVVVTLATMVTKFCTRHYIKQGRHVSQISLRHLVTLPILVSSSDGPRHNYMLLSMSPSCQISTCMSNMSVLRDDVFNLCKSN